MRTHVSWIVEKEKDGDLGAGGDARQKQFRWEHSTEESGACRPRKPPHGGWRSANIKSSMLDRWTERVPVLHGDLTTLREVATEDVYSLFTLFSNPAVTAYMAPPPPTLAKFAGFVEWSHQQRARGKGVCFGIIPDGMAAAVGILQVRFDPTLPGAEWGFVLSAHFWSTGVFSDAANAVVEFAFTTMQIDRLEARIAQRNRRAHAAVQKLGARFESTIPSSSPEGIPRDPESVFGLREDDWRRRTIPPRLSPHDAAQRIVKAVEAAESELRRSEAPDTVEPYPLFLFDRRRRV
jgi:[ribosomal protein S5]-alanine N-acetyltransferase